MQNMIPCSWEIHPGCASHENDHGASWQEHHRYVFVEVSNFEDYEKGFQKLRQVLSGESFVHIRGCAVGQNEKLLVKFAKAFSVPVYAGTSAENVLLDFNFGDIMVSYPGGGVYTTTRP
jgi:hypothetical protein